MAPNTLVTGLMAKLMVAESKLCLMELPMMVTGMMENSKKASAHILMGSYMTVNGSMVNLMVME
jgi:hypothetical protein